jgi:hypothetical protein
MGSSHVWYGTYAEPIGVSLGSLVVGSLVVETFSSHSKEISPFCKSLAQPQTLWCTITLYVNICNIDTIRGNFKNKPVQGTSIRHSAMQQHGIF